MAIKALEWPSEGTAEVPIWWQYLQVAELRTQYLLQIPL